MENFCYKVKITAYLYIQDTEKASTYISFSFFSSIIFSSFQNNLFSQTSLSSSSLFFLSVVYSVATLPPKLIFLLSFPNTKVSSCVEYIGLSISQQNSYFLSSQTHAWKKSDTRNRLEENVCRWNCNINPASQSLTCQRHPFFSIFPKKFLVLRIMPSH